MLDVIGQGPRVDLPNLPLFVRRLAPDLGLVLDADIGLKVYFCEPRSPWQRGTNENTNGLLRQYFPKGTDLARYNETELAAVANMLNK